MGKDGEYDVFRDGPLRFLGYSNEVGEAFRPLVTRTVVSLLYGVTVTYVLADVYHKSSRTYNRTGSSGRAIIKAGDVFLWQMLASVIIPGFTINRITWAAGKLIHQMKASKTAQQIFPTAVGLASIPFIIRPIDSLVDLFMDVTYRNVFDV